MDEIKLDSYRERSWKPTIITLAVMVFSGALLFAIISIYDSIMSAGYTSVEPNPALVLTIHGMVFEALNIVLFVAFVALILYLIISYFVKKESFWGYLAIMTFFIFFAVFVMLSFTRAAADAVYVLSLPPADQWINRYMDGPTTVYETSALRSAIVNVIFCILVAFAIILLVWNYIRERKVKTAFKDVTINAGGKSCVVIENEKVCWLEGKE